MMIWPLDYRMNTWGIDAETPVPMRCMVFKCEEAAPFKRRLRTHNSIPPHREWITVCYGHLL